MKYLSVHLNVIGTDLDPADVTAAINTQPTDSFRKGDPVGRPGHVHYRRHGLWSLGVYPQGDKLHPTLEACLRSMLEDKQALRSVKGIEIMRVVIYVEPSTTAALEFDIAPSIVKQIAELGATICITVEGLGDLS